MAKIPIGQHLYLHTMSSGFAPRVLITAHGGIGKKMPQFNLPAGVTARFFTDHTTVLPDPGVTSVLEGKVSAKESITGGACYNYELSKYQGSHGGTKGKPAETYESITRSLGNFASLETGMMKMGGPVIEKATYQGVDALTKQEQAVWRMLMATYQQHGQPFKDFCDVITIRNRKMSLKTITLEYVVEQVLKVNPGYRTFECSFCRSLM